MPNNPDRVPNHTVDPTTGFLESKAYAHAFNAQRKQRFLDVYKENGLGLYRTCKILGLSHSTVNSACKHDPVFKEAFEQAMTEYADDLEAVSRHNALNPKSVIERIFQLKSLFPSKYADQRNVGGSTNIQINFDGKAMTVMNSREEVINVNELKNEPDFNAEFDDREGVTGERPLE